MKLYTFRPNRRDFVFGAASLTAMASSLQAAGSLAGKKITFYEPYGPNSGTHNPLALTKAALEDATGALVKIETRPGKAGELALKAAAAHASDELAFAVTDLLALQVIEALEADNQFIAQFKPLGLLGPAGSATLVVANEAPHKTIEDLLSVGKGRPLRIGHIGRKSSFGVPLALMETYFEIKFEDYVLDTRTSIISALTSGSVDAAFLATDTLLPTPTVKTLPIRGILTFGGERNPVLNIPTFRETAAGMERRNSAITTIAACFAPRGMDNDLFTMVQSALAEVFQREDLQEIALKYNYLLRFGPVSDFDVAMRRNARIIDFVKPRLLGE